MHSLGRRTSSESCASFQAASKMGTWGMPSEGAGTLGSPLLKQRGQRGADMLLPQCEEVGKDK